MSDPIFEAGQVTNQSESEETFLCHCGEWRFTNAHFVVDEIRKDVCRDLPFYREIDGKKYCLLHYPHESKAIDFKPVFEARIASNDWDFRMVYFPEPLAYENQEFKTKADFGHATFAKRVSFKYCKFRATFVFFDAHFLVVADFAYSEFFDQANFNAVEFQDHGGFVGVKFHENSRPLFQGTTFNSGTFSSAEFHPDAVFKRSTFNERADFFDAKFFSKADFEAVTLPQADITDFRQAMFNDALNFDGVEFHETYFTRAKFAASTSPTTKQTNFKNCKFTRRVTFAYAEFHSPVDFSNSLFQNVHFESATFHDQASFLECSFMEDVFFNDTAFGFRSEHRITSSDVIFDGASFGKDSRVFFDNTWFSWHTSFDYAKFDGYVFFKGSEKNPVFGAIFESHAFWSLLKILNATFDRPDKVYFQAVRLRPSWFVNVTAELRKFNFTNIEWSDENRAFITIAGELKVIEKLEKHNSKRLLAIVFRQLAENAETNSRFEEASMFRRLAMDTEWLEKRASLRNWIGNVFKRTENLKSRFNAGDFLIHGLYRFTSRYGESWAQASGILLLLLFVGFPLIYTQTNFQICPREKPVAMSIAVCESKDEEVKKNCECTRGGLDFGGAVVHSLTTATLQNVDYRKPTTKKGETVIILEKIFAPLQAALLALALRRKFMR